MNGFIGKKIKIGKIVTVVDEIIAEGGFGVVFKVKANNNQVYALKRICVNNSKDLKVCKREITILSSLTHKNIIPLVDSQIIQKAQGIHEVFMLLNYCPNSVIQLMKSKQQMNQILPEALILNIMCDVIEAVARLHHCVTPVIHRDLKVDNILINDRNNFVLCDFGSATARHIIPTDYGLAKTEEEISRYTTLAYRPPEMVQLSSQILDCKTDIWALGVMLYYLCFFSLPFGDNILAIQSGNFVIPTHPPSSISCYLYSNNLLKLIKYLLTINPRERPSIFQVSQLVFGLANKRNPVQNLEREKVPLWNDLPLPSGCDQKYTVSNLRNNSKSSSNKYAAPVPIPTSQTQLSMINNTKSENVPLKSTLKAASQQKSGSLFGSVSTSINPRNRPRPIKSVPQTFLFESDRNNYFDVCTPSEQNNKGSEMSECFSKQQQSKNPFIETKGITSKFNSRLNEDRVERPYSQIQSSTKVRPGHRRMASEHTTLRFSLENIGASIKSSQSSQELAGNRMDLFTGSGVSDDYWFNPEISDDRICALEIVSYEENVDDLFAAEFDKRRNDKAEAQ